MANVLKHRFTSAKADGADATQVQPSHWNDGHLFTGGNAGDVLTRDPTDATFGATWKPSLLTSASGTSSSTAPAVLASLTVPAGMLAIHDALAVTVTASVGAVATPVPLQLFADDGTTGKQLLALTGATGGGDLVAATPVGQFHTIIRAHVPDSNYLLMSAIGGTSATFTQVRAFTYSAFEGPMGGWMNAWFLRLVQPVGLDPGGTLQWSWIVHRIG